MCVEVDLYGKSLFQLGHKAVDACGVNQTCHILEADHLGAGSNHFLSFVYKVFVGEYFLVGVLGVNCVANGCIGNAAQLVDETDRLADVVDIVQRIENTHYVKTILDSLFVETFKHAVGIRNISEQVAAT